ncbi:glycosyltransferase [Zunongwangia sp.]|uniref:glycosyltransferase n=1 Tax=Zunongwangia sp. TaxID=1965325 RepID=UPI003AA7B75F
MKILHVVDKMNPKAGGVCQAIRMMIKALSDSEIKNEVVCLDNKHEAKVAEDDFLIYALGRVNNPWQYSSLLKDWLKNNINDYQIVIIHGLWQYYGYAVYKVFKSLKTVVPKLLVMPHGMLDPYFQEASGRKLKAIRNWGYWKLIEKNIINSADELLFTCKTELMLARKPFTPYLPKSEKVVGLGITKPPTVNPQIEISFFEHCGLNSTEDFILFLGRIHPKKGVLMLLKAYQELLKHDNKIPKLVLAGPGVDSPYGLLVKKMLAENEKLKEQVIVPGMLSGNLKWGAFYTCKAFVLPSHQENFGIAIVEALACGKPVLITDKINIYTEIEEYDAGLVAKDTLESIIEMLQNWISFSKKNQKKMADNALRCYENLFTTEAFTTRIISIKDTYEESRKDYIPVESSVRQV